MEIFLASETITSLPPNPAYVRIYIAGWWDELEGNSWALTGNDAHGTARHYSTATDFEVATSGGIAVDEIDDGNSVEGTIDVIFPSAGRIRGDFRAEWVPLDQVCL
jgi:hypothetical protein